MKEIKNGVFEMNLFITKEEQKILEELKKRLHTTTNDIIRAAIIRELKTYSEEQNEKPQNIINL